MIKGGDLDILTSDAIKDTKSRTYDKYYLNKHIPRSLFYDLKRLLESGGYDDDEAEKGVFDAVDPTWPCFPSPLELQMDSTFDEISGHLSLIIASAEAWRPALSSDKKTVSKFQLFKHPFAHRTSAERMNWTQKDMRRFDVFSGFIKHTWTTDHYLTRENIETTDRFGLFVTKTVNWVGMGKDYNKYPLHAWVAWISKGKGRIRLLIFDPNNTKTPGTTIHKSELIPIQSVFIKDVQKGWKSITKNDLFYVTNPGGNPDGRCMELCSVWLQKTLRDENWRNFPLTDREILKSATRIDMSDRGRKPYSRSTSPASTEPRQTRSRSQSSSDSRATSPARLALPTLRRQTSRLNISQHQRHQIKWETLQLHKQLQIK